jgi:hypothetical protein
MRRLNGVWIAAGHDYTASIHWSLCAVRKKGEHIVKNIQGG